MMGFWCFMLIMSLLIPLVMIGFGRQFIVQPPANINEFYGYRTPMSKKNPQTWAFAHQFCGRLWVRRGIILLPLSIIALLPLRNQPFDIVGIAGAILCTLQCIPLLASVLSTEHALKKTFDENGAPRKSPAP